MNKSSYFDNDVLCETDWVSDNLDNPNIKILEVDYDIENAYKTGHIKGAHMVWWKKDINDLLTRDLLTKSQFESLMSRVGATPESTLILYGDFNNWFAAFAFWVFKYYGHKNIKLMNGGRKKWELEKREYTTDEPSSVEKTVYTSTAPNEGIRAYLSDVKRALEKKETMLVDVRSNKEFNGINFKDYCFVGTDLRNTVFVGCNIMCSSFVGADLRGTDFINCKFSYMQEFSGGPFYKTQINSHTKFVISLGPEADMKYFEELYEDNGMLL